MNTHLVTFGFAAMLAGCATADRSPDTLAGIRVMPDNPAAPQSVRFEVPSALLFGQPGDRRIPVTLQARIATREIAVHELSARDYCPNGFTGPQGIHFPGGDRSRSVFVVDCVG